MPYTARRERSVQIHGTHLRHLYDTKTIVKNVGDVTVAGSVLEVKGQRCAHRDQSNNVQR